MTWFFDLLELLFNWSENTNSSFQSICRMALSLCILVGVIMTVLFAGLFAMVGIAAAPIWLQWTVGSIVSVAVIVGAFYPGGAK